MFSVWSSETETFNSILCNPEISPLGKDVSRKSFLWPPLERSLSVTVNKPLCWQTPRKLCIYMFYLKKVPNPDWSCTPTDDLKVTISRNWSIQQQKETTFPRWADQEFLLSCGGFLLSVVLWWWFLLFLLERRCFNLNFSVYLLQKGETSLTIGTITRNCFAHNVRDSVVLPVANVSIVSNDIDSYTYKPMGISYQIRLLPLGVPIPCFDPSQLQPC